MMVMMMKRRCLAICKYRCRLREILSIRGFLATETVTRCNALVLIYVRQLFETISLWLTSNVLIIFSQFLALSQSFLQGGIG
jgi:hypothetical protein